MVCRAVNRTDFVELHPQLFHMAADGTWPSIQIHGLLSTSAVLDLVGVDGDRRVELETRRRIDSVQVSGDGVDFVLRDQKPLHERKLASCLVDMTVGEWLTMLNHKVFLWPSREKCARLLNAKAYRDSWHTVIEFDTAALLDRYAVTVSPINSGSVLYNPPRRGSFTFTTIGEFPVERYRKRGKRKMVAEVAVDYALPDAGELAIGVWRARRDEWEPVE